MMRNNFQTRLNRIEDRLQIGGVSISPEERRIFRAYTRFKWAEHAKLQDRYRQGDQEVLAELQRRRDVRLNCSEEYMEQRRAEIFELQASGAFDEYYDDWT